MAEERCANCHRRFNGHCRPRWAFTRDGYPAGRVHGSFVPSRQSSLYVAGVGEAFDDAHFRFWVSHIRLPWQAHVDRDLLGFYHHPTETLSDSQQEQLAWWIETKGYSPERIASIVAAHTALVRVFWAWRTAMGRQG